MTTKLISALQGSGQSMADYTKQLELMIENEYQNIRKFRSIRLEETAAILHQTAASDGRLHTTIQINVL